MSDARIELPAVLTHEKCEELHEFLKNSRNSTVVVNAAAVKKIGGAGLQLLLTAVNTWRADGKAFSVENQTEAFTHVINCLGFDTAFSDRQSTEL